MCGRSTGEDGEYLQNLLGMIDDVRNLHLPAPVGLSPDEYIETQLPEF
jgi:hypothetical protein